jgi:very-short-patch-repair endonuclease
MRRHANVRHDAERTAFLESRGYRVLRLANGDIMSNVEDIAAFIFVEATARLRPPPDPRAC